MEGAMTAHPYRVSSAPPAERPRRWGATWWVRLVTSLARTKRRAKRKLMADMMADVLQAREACFAQIRADVGFFYRAECWCGDHERAMRADGIGIWRLRMPGRP